MQAVKVNSCGVFTTKESKGIREGRERGIQRAKGEGIDTLLRYPVAYQVEVSMVGWSISVN